MEQEGGIPERGRTPLGACSGALLGCRRGRTPPAPLAEMAGPKLFPPPDLLVPSPPLMGEVAFSRMSPSPRRTNKPEPPHPRWIPSLQWLVPSGGNGGGGMRVAAGRNPRSVPVPASFASALPARRRDVARVVDDREGGKAAGARG
jgi:hypothetical protein